VVDSQSLPADAVHEFQSRVDAVREEGTDPHPSGPRSPDATTVRLEIDDEQGRHTTSFEEGAATVPQEALLQWVISSPYRRDDIAGPG
jgi:hypothetical protein